MIAHNFDQERLLSRQQRNGLSISCSDTLPEPGRAAVRQADADGLHSAFGRFVILRRRLE
jgi:hypothetical protein